MATSGYVLLAPSSNSVFPGANANDMLFYVNSGQKMYFGLSNSSNFIKLSSNIVSIVGNLDVSGSLTKNGTVYSSGGGGFTGSSLSISGPVNCSYLSVTNGATQSSQSSGSGSGGNSSGLVINTGSNNAYTGIAGDSSNDLTFALMSSNQYANFVVYNSNGTTSNEIVRLTGQGYVGIGTTSPLYPLDVNGTARANSVLYTTLTQTSDERVKENVVSTDLAWAEDTISKLRVVDYNFIGNVSSPKVGFIAQEVESVFPIATKTVKDYVPITFGPAPGLVNATLSNQTLSINSIGYENIINIGDIYKFVHSDGLETNVITIESNISTNSYTISGGGGNDVFATGNLQWKQVDNFKTLDYQAITSALVGTVQMLLKRVEILEGKISV